MPRPKDPLDKMLPGWKKPPTEHFRCPACGAHSPPEKFADGKTPPYPIERVRWVNNAGGSRKGQWTPGFPTKPDDLLVLQWALIYALADVQMFAKAHGLPVYLARDPSQP
jgi:hypothetical protein